MRVCRDDVECILTCRVLDVHGHVTDLLLPQEAVFSRYVELSLLGLAVFDGLFHILLFYPSIFQKFLYLLCHV